MSGTAEFGHSATTIALLALAGFVAALARGFSGFGAALIFMPLGSALVGPAVTSAVMLVVDAVCALWMVPPAIRVFERRAVAVMALGSTLTVPLGTWLLVESDPIALRWSFCVIIAAMLILLMSGWRFRGQAGVPVTVGVGMASGLLSGVAQMGGPPVVVYWLGGDSTPSVMRANLVMFFLWGTVVTLLSYGSSGLLSPEVLWLSLICGPAYLVGIVLGSRMFHLAAPRTFRRICYALIALAALVGMPR